MTRREAIAPRHRTYALLYMVAGDKLEITWNISVDKRYTVRKVDMEVG